MFLFGHTGMGLKLASPWARGLSFSWLLVGTLLPDLLDKPLYYGLRLLTGQFGGELGIISGTRTFGHTAIFLFTLTALGWARQSRPLAALALGTATHLLLDNLSDRFLHSADSSALQALVFPLLGAHFAVIPFSNAQEHLRALVNPVTLAGEGLGGALLGWEIWKRRHESEILKNIRESVRRLRRARRGQSPRPL